MQLAMEKEVGLSDDQQRVALTEVAAGSREAMTRLFLAYHRRLFNFVFRLTRSFTIAEELVNDIMLIVWQKAATFRGESRVSTWIFGIAYRQTMRRLKRKKINLVDKIEVDQLPEDGDITSETQDWVSHGLQRLPSAQQITMVLVFYLGLSYEETAAVVDCPVNTVKTRMFHARRKLKDIMQTSAVPARPSDGDE